MRQPYISTQLTWLTLVCTSTIEPPSVPQFSIQTAVLYLSVSMLSPALNASVGNNTPQYFTPPSGGDITLRSSDGVSFLVHSTILKFTSSTFNGMIATCTSKTTIELSESASDVSNLLRFIYPNKLPLTIGPDMLPGCLKAVQKYNVEGAVEIIDELIALDTPPHKFLSSDPIRVFQLALQFNLVKTRAAATPLVISAAGQVDFCDLSQASEFAQKYSPLGLVYLMNFQAMRAKLLSDVLFQFDIAPIQPLQSDPDMFWDLCCQPCRNVNKTAYKRIPPSWALAWVRLVYKTLLISPGPLAKSDYLFQSTVLGRFQERQDVCQECLSDYRLYSNQGVRFDHWAQVIKDALEAQLAKLELLYAL
ncbi:hypothetical protein ACGC1H_000951 [Rhizoctonia solani]